jgi:hypothetical protein
MRIVTTIYEKKEDGNTTCRRGLVEVENFLLDEVVVDGCRYGVGMLISDDGGRRKTRAIIFREDSMHVWTIDLSDTVAPHSRTNVAQLGGVNYFNEMAAMAGYMEMEYPKDGPPDFRIVEVDRYWTKTMEEVVKEAFGAAEVE